MLLPQTLTLALAAYRGAAIAIGQPINQSTHGLQSPLPETLDPKPDLETRAPDLIPNQWIVVLKNRSKRSAAEHADWATSIHLEHPEGLAGVLRVFNYNSIKVRGYAGEFSDRTVKKIRKDKDASSFLLIVSGET